MAEIVIFGGTTEGRKLAEACASMQITTCVCVVSDYGEQLLPDSEYIKTCVGALGQQEMEGLLRSEAPVLVFDATHPYAAQVSVQAAGACEHVNMAYFRVLREELSAGQRENEIWADSIDEAVAVLAQDDRPVLVTTGSKELRKYQALKNFKERIYARVLPGHDGIGACEAIGLPGSHIIAMQGPFSRQLNEALLQQLKAGWLVTKESGSHGGFMEKIRAARAVGVKIIIIGRPVKEEGISLTAACQKAAGLKGFDDREMALIGIGMGSPELMTIEAVTAIRSCEALLGAPRMLKAAQAWNEHAETGYIYRPDDVLAWLEARPWLKKIGILLSGDTGFYSGAKALKQKFEQKSDREGYRWRLRMLPGISTVSYLCARIGTGWEDVYLCSLHGRDCDLAEAVRLNQRVFCLLGGQHPIQELCGRLAGFSDLELKVTIGAWLSYPQERIISGTLEEIGRIDSGSFCAALIERNT